MKLLNQILSPLKKISKGMFALFALSILVSTCIFIFDSCKKSEYEHSNEGEAGIKFMATLNEVRTKLSTISLLNSNSVSSRYNPTNGMYCISFPTGTNQDIINDFTNNTTVQSLYNILATNGAKIYDTLSAACSLTIQVPELQITSTLQLLVDEAKNYLYAKGVTDQEIMNVIQEEGAAEIDLIPYVKTLVAVEQGQYAIRKMSIPLINEANAGFLSCGISALGGDAFYALSQSTASTWAWAVMKKAFKTVASKMLGPIGVAVAVVTFAMCMLQ